MKNISLWIIAFCCVFNISKGFAQNNWEYRSHYEIAYSASNTLVFKMKPKTWFREIINDLLGLGQPDTTYVDPIQPTQSVMTMDEVNEYNIQIERQRTIREETVSKWDNLGFLDGLEGHVSENIVQLYESEAV